MSTATDEPGSVRAAEARRSAEDRLRRERNAARPLGLVVVAAVTAAAVGGKPAPGLHGEAIGVTIALCVFAGGLAALVRLTIRSRVWTTVVVVALAAAGVALVALQERGVTSVAGVAAVWMAVARLPQRVGLAIAVGTTAALDLAAALAGGSAAAIFAITLLCALLGFVAYFLQRAREGHARTELLLAELEDARDAQLRAAALEERGRIATELHDVLAHSLSGAALQLQGARVLADREHADPEVRTAIDRASELVKDGLANARHAVGALRGDDLPDVEDLAALVEDLRDDLNVDAELMILGTARALPADVGLALYRGAQEALTNVARYAPGATTTLVLHYDVERTLLTVEDRRVEGSDAVGLDGIGGGRGLDGLRERVERLGGTMHAGPTDAGWRVDVELPV